MLLRIRGIGSRLVTLLLILSSFLSLLLHLIALTRASPPDLHPDNPPLLPSPLPPGSRTPLLRTAAILLSFLPDSSTIALQERVGGGRSLSSFEVFDLSIRFSPCGSFGVPLALDYIREEICLIVVEGSELVLELVRL